MQYYCFILRKNQNMFKRLSAMNCFNGFFLNLNYLMRPYANSSFVAFLYKKCGRRH